MEDLYVKLREKLDTLGVGFPPEANGGDIAYIKVIFSEEHARVFIAMEDRFQLPEEVAKTTADEEELVEVGVFELIEAFNRIVSQIDKKELMEIDLEKLSLTDIINEIMEQLSLAKNLTFEDLLRERKDRRRIIYTFLALLELIKLRMIKAYQTSVFGVIRIFPAVES